MFNRYFQKLTSTFNTIPRGQNMGIEVYRVSQKKFTPRKLLIILKFIYEQ